MKTHHSMITTALIVLLAAPSLAAAGETVKVEMGDLTLTVPKTWKQQDPSSRMRLGQFKIPAVKGDSEPAELAVFYFGQRGAGGVEANIKRWIGQFDEAGREVERSDGDSAQGKFDLVKIAGTYNKSIGPPVLRKTESKPDFLVLAAVVHTKSGDYFLKFAGPQKTVAESERDFYATIGAKPSGSDSASE